MTRHKAIDIVGGILGVTIFVGVLVVGLALSAFPMLGRLVAGTQKIETPLVKIVEPGGTSSGATTSAAAAPVADATPKPQENNVIRDYLVDRFIQRADRSLPVCAELTDLRNGPPQTPPAFQQALFRLASGDNLDAAYMESALAVVGAFLGAPPITAVVTDLNQARASGTTAITDNADFPGRAAEAVNAAVVLGPALERVSQLAYHLQVLTRAAFLRPERANDSIVQDLCARLVGEIAQEPRRQSQIDLSYEKSQLLQALAGLGLSPQQVGFNPNLRNQVLTEIDQRTVTIDTPWLRQMMGGRFVVIAPPGAQ